MHIHEIPIFKSFTPEEVIELQASLHAHSRSYQKEEMIYSSGQNTSQMGILIQGQVSITHMNEDGEASLVSYVEEGECFAETFALLQVRLPIFVQATKTSVVLFLNLHLLNESSHASHVSQKFLFILAQLTARKNLQMNQRMKYLTHKKMQSRLLAYFQDLKHSQANNPIVIPFQRQELADFLCIDRSAMSRELSKMQKNDLISISKNQIYVKC